MELALATVFVSPIVKTLIIKVLSYCPKEIALVWGVKDQLEKLARTLELIDAVLQDAEMRQVKSNLLVIWLGELKNVAHDADDILDELQYEDLGRKMKNESKVLRFLPSKPFGFGYKISHQIKEVNKKLDEITQGMKKFQFINQLGGSSLNTVRDETCSHNNDSAAVVGRKDDLSEILYLLTQETYSVVRITGMGGIGKTTLAQLVYAKFADDKSLKDHFQIKMWVSMYGKSSSKDIFGDLLKSNVERHSSLDDIIDGLIKRLAVGKCLIILDDVWINHGIDVKELLKHLLSAMSSKGSKILMTMRSAEDIPPMKDCRYKIYPLQCLPEDDCWSIIKNTAFGDGGAKETTNLVNIGKQIASKCGGLPLAAKTLGGLLYSKRNEKEWSSILNSQIWNLPPTDDKIISILKLSYDHLSPYVKRCFSYCSIFPKGHEFFMKELIRMWMAEGFLNASPETLGNDYFKTLLLNSFFQDERKNKWGDTKSCIMHDLVHDLAISIAGSESWKLTTDDGPEVIKQSNKLRRLGLQFLSYNHYEIPLEIYKASKKLYTFVSFYPDYFRLFNNGPWTKQIFSLSLLRVLNLSRTGIKELPQSMGKLKHLRSLNLSHTEIKTFPRSFSHLYNLQILTIKFCPKLEKFPTNMRKLISLEYFVFNYKVNKLTQMPREVSRFTKLKKLSRFIVGIGKGYGIEELKDLNALGGKLVIRKLRNARDAKQANLKGKEKITHLRLDWDSQSCDDSDRCNKDNGVINDLQPHPNLRKLTIASFGGSKFPTWMMQLPNMVHIILDKCGKCEHLPALGRLPYLRYLYMESMDAIKKIGNEFYQSNGQVSFPSLVELYLRSLLNLEEWSGDQPSSTSSFPCLETLEISACPMLITTPTGFPSLKNLDFEIRLVDDHSLKLLPLKLLRGANSVLQTLLVSDCDEFVGFLPGDEQQQKQPDNLSNNFLSKIEILRCPSLTVLPADFRGLNSLTYLAIEGCSRLQSLPDGIQFLPALQTLIIGGFSEDLEYFPFPAATGSDGERYFVSLRDLTIRGWPTLRTVLPDELQLLTSLLWLSIRDFSCLVSLPEWLGELSSLQDLDIQNCRELKYLPSEEQMLRLTSLQNLNIGSGSCPLLCSGNEELHKIAHCNLTQESSVSRSSPSLLDHITRDADMNVELLARRRFGVFSNQNKEKCWTDSSGRNCFMLFPMSFQITWKDNPKYWTWLSMMEPSSSGDVEIEVPELVRVCWLSVHGKLEISRLSPGVIYEVVFVVMFRKRSSGWDTPVDLWLVLPDGQRIVQKVILETMPKSQWIEIHLGDFETPQQPGVQETEIKFSLLEQQVLNWKNGLVVEGAIIRPKK